MTYETKVIVQANLLLTALKKANAKDVNRMVTLRNGTGMRLIFYNDEVEISRCKLEGYQYNVDISFNENVSFALQKLEKLLPTIGRQEIRLSLSEIKLKLKVEL